MPDDRTSKTRDDGGAETSISWEDDSDVIRIVARDKGATAHGIARLPRVGLDSVVALPGCAGGLSYERREEPNNKHHGNLVFAAGLDKLVSRMIASALALHSELTPKP